MNWLDLLPWAAIALVAAAGAMRDAHRARRDLISLRRHERARAAFRRTP